MHLPRYIERLPPVMENIPLSSNVMFWAPVVHVIRKWRHNPYRLGGPHVDISKIIRAALAVANLGKKLELAI